MSSNPIEMVLSRLEKVRQRQAGQWSARCPAHADKGPSLSVRETPEGAVLLHCFAGCSGAEVVSSMGIEMTDLFPPRERTGREPKRLARVIAPAQSLEILQRESMFVAIVATDMVKGERPTPDTHQRLLQAVGRINDLTLITKVGV